jgi:hypothetical protein
MPLGEFLALLIRVRRTRLIALKKLPGIGMGPLCFNLDASQAGAPF